MKLMGEGRGGCLFERWRSTEDLRFVYTLCSPERTWTACQAWLNCFRLYLVFSDWRYFRIPALGSFREGGRCLSTYRWVIKHWSNKRYLSTLGWLFKPNTKVLGSVPWVIIVLDKLTQRFQPCQLKKRRFVERHSRAHERRRRKPLEWSRGILSREKL